MLKTENKTQKSVQVAMNRDIQMRKKNGWTLKDYSDQDVKDMIELVDKYEGKLLTQKGDFNLRVVRAIILKAGVKKPLIYNNWLGSLTINFEVIDTGFKNDAEEILNFYNFGKWLVKDNPDWEGI